MHRKQNNGFEKNKIQKKWLFKVHEERELKRRTASRTSSCMVLSSWYRDYNTPRLVLKAPATRRAAVCGV